jgi:hypothetical protein
MNELLEALRDIISDYEDGNVTQASINKGKRAIENLHTHESYSVNVLIALFTDLKDDGYKTLTEDELQHVVQSYPTVDDM